MARIRQITAKDEVPADKHDIFDSIATSRGRVSGPFSVLLNSPEVAGRAAHLGAYIRFESTLSPADRELAIITTSREFDCGYEWSAHATLASDHTTNAAISHCAALRGEIWLVSGDFVSAAGRSSQRAKSRSRALWPQ